MKTTTSTEKGLKSSQENFNNNIEKHVREPSARPIMLFINHKIFGSLVVEVPFAAVAANIHQFGICHADLIIVFCFILLRFWLRFSFLSFHLLSVWRLNENLPIRKSMQDTDISVYAMRFVIISFTRCLICVSPRAVSQCTPSTLKHSMRTTTDKKVQHFWWKYTSSFAYLP